MKHRLGRRHVYRRTNVTWNDVRVQARYDEDGASVYEVPFGPAVVLVEPFADEAAGLYWWRITWRRNAGEPPITRTDVWIEKAVAGKRRLVRTSPANPQFVEVVGDAYELHPTER